ncbi:hypothetical protein [Rhizobium sp. BK251]|uniref:hypothetical protein n=1 Tax=Rhizobium sp. BK251 TaxID=2512125 RepID=UPI00104532F6|nr:hypothetical protein [Rhizobium sp. BK251]TCL70669.1 hypothetical protein EV286_107547 [Rhizobium sp. BK251]
MRTFIQIQNWSPGYMNVCPAHVVILVECKACGERREFDKHSLPPSLHHALVTTVESRLKCTSCGEKSGKMLFGHYGKDGE